MRLIFAGCFFIFLSATVHLLGADPIVKTLTFVGLDVKGAFFYQSDKGTYTPLNIPPFASSPPISYLGESTFKVYRNVKTEEGVTHELVGQVDLSNVSSALVVISTAAPGKLKLEVLDSDWTKFPEGSYRLYNRMTSPVGVMVGKSRDLLRPGEVHQKSADGASYAKIIIAMESGGVPTVISNNVLFFTPNHRETVFIIESDSDFFSYSDDQGRYKGGKYHMVYIDEENKETAVTDKNPKSRN